MGWVWLSIAQKIRNPSNGFVYLFRSVFRLFLFLSDFFDDIFGTFTPFSNFAEEVSVLAWTLWSFGVSLNSFLSHLMSQMQLIWSGLGVRHPLSLMWIGISSEAVTPQMETCVVIQILSRHSLPYILIYILHEAHCGYFFFGFYSVQCGIVIDSAASSSIYSNLNLEYLFIYF